MSANRLLFSAKGYRLTSASRSTGARRFLNLAQVGVAKLGPTEVKRAELRSLSRHTLHRRLCDRRASEPLP
jgi:hypothetical protein